MANETMTDIGTLVGNDIKNIRDVLVNPVYLSDDAIFSGYGNTERVDNTDRFMETDTPNVIVDTVGDEVRFSDGLVDTLGDELVTNGDFSNGTTGWNTGRGAILSVRDEKIYIKNSSLASGYTTQMIPTQAGKTYTCSVQMLTSNDGTPFGITVNSTDAYIGDLYNMYNGTLRKEYETLEFTFTAINTTSYLVLIVYGGYTNSTEQSYDNISVKELPQAELPLAPFAQGSTDEIIAGKEELPNSNFNSDVSDWEGQFATLVWDSGKAKFTTSTASGYIQTVNQMANLGSGTYTLTMVVSSVSGGTVTFDINGTNYLTATTAGTYITEITGNFNNSKPKIENSVNGAVTVIDSVSMVLATSKVTVNNHAKADIVITEDGDNIYQAITDTTAGDLVTDTSKFQVIDAVTRYDVIAYSKSGYKTYKGIGSYDESMSTDDIATAQGWSKLDNGLYSDGVDEITSLRVVQRLNAGAYHPAFNNHGCSLSHDPSSTGIQTWYRSNITSTFEACTERAIADSSVVGYVPNTGMIGFVDNPSYTRRPDGKFYDKIYNEGTGGIVGVGTYTTDDISLDIESTKLMSGSGLERGVEINKMPPRNSDNGILYPYSTTSTVIYVDGNNKTRFKIGDVIQAFHYDGVSTILSGIVTASDPDSITVNNYIPSSLPIATITFSGFAYIVESSNSLLTQNGNLSIDVIGDPANYSQDWKDRLASGKSLPFNALLVGENGEDYLDGRQTYKIISKGVQELDSQFMDISSFVWGSVARPFDTITNTYGALSDSLTRIWLCNTTSRNKSLYKSTLLPIEYISNKVIGNNSHSIYKGAIVTNAITNKISVGNGSNGLESRTLENAELDENNVLQTIPQHNTIALDIENSPASKYFTSLAVDDNGEYVIQVTGKELAYNSATTSYDGDTPDFTQLTNGTEIDLNGVAVKTANLIKRLGVFKK